MKRSSCFMALAAVHALGTCQPTRCKNTDGLSWRTYPDPLTPDAARFDSVVAAVEVSGDTAKSSVDVVGSLLGGRTVLELARRGRVRFAIALDPGGFGTAEDVVRGLTSIPP